MGVGAAISRMNWEMRNIQSWILRPVFLRMRVL
jgi:hypothetical protein